MDDIFAPQDDFSIDDLQASKDTSIQAPESVIRNRAASYAAMTDVPENLVQDYQAMMAESQSGQDFVRSRIANTAEKKIQRSNQAALMSILADTSISIADKQKALEQVRNQNVDPVEVLTTSSAIASNPDENHEQEGVRISLASSLKELTDAKNKMQGIVNAHALSLPVQSGTATSIQAVEAWMVPFATSKSVASIVSGIREKQDKPVSLVDFVQAIALPGSAKQALINELNGLTPAARLKMMEDLRNVISSSSGIILSENNFNKMILGQELLDGDYSDTSAFFDNITPVFDAIALGGLAREAKSAYNALKAPKVIQGITDTIPEALKGSIGIVEGDLSKVSAPPNVRGNGEIISKLLSEKESLLGDMSGKADKGVVKGLEEQLAGLQAPSKDVKSLAKDLQKKGVSYKEAYAKAERMISDAEADYQATRLRIEQQLRNNAKASQAEQRIAAIEQEIAKLSKKNPPNTAKNELAASIESIGLRSTVGTYHPLAPGNVIGTVNPSKARNIHATLLVASEEYAQAMFGTTKSEALALNVMPQPSTPNGNILARTPDIERSIRAGVGVSEQLLNILKKGGALNLTASESTKAASAIKNDFRNASGLVLNDAMSSFEVFGDQFKVKGFYGTTEGGFAKAEDALATAIVALRKYGIEPKDLSLYGRKGDEFVKLDSEAINTGLKEYYVSVERTDELPSFFANDTDWTTKWNFFDRVQGLVNTNFGSLTRHLFTSGMIVDPKFAGAASRASDFTSAVEKVMLGIADDFANKFNSLEKVEKAKVSDYLKEANFKELPFDYADLTGNRGFTQEMVDTVTSWRKYWDNNFYLENLDMVRSLRNQGYQKFVGANNTELFAKSIPKNINAANVYDVMLDQMVRMSRQELDNLYNTGGTVARLRRPEVINGNHVEHVVVRNNAGEYLRGVTDNDRVLNYKDGYFQIQYQAPKFVDEISDVQGQMVRRAIAVAGDSLEAETFAKRMRASNPNNQYVVRSDDRAVARSGDDWWDLQASSGRIAQRHRGQLLQEAAGMNHLGDTEFILDPVNSAIRAARSIAGRTVGRPFLESAKARVMAKYGHVLPQHPTTKEVMWPSEIGQIGTKGGQHTADVRDARTMYEYIHAMENGYINSIDSTVKGLMLSLADMVGSQAKKGNKVAAKVERSIGRADTLSRPASLTKNGVFTTLVAMNPFRQLVVQPHTALRLYAYDAVAAAKAQGRLAEYIGNIAGVTQSASAKHLSDFMEESGMLAAVDKHNMVRGALLDASESSHPVTGAIGKVTGGVRKIGFDLGEQANQFLHLATVYERFKALGKDLDNPVVRAQAYSEARALSYSMNFAGDLPYNQNALGFVLQFAQIPHKAIAQIFERQLTAGQRLRLVGGDILMFGPPVALLSSIFNGDILPEDPKLRAALQQGIEQWSINNLFSKIAGRNVDIDISSLNPYDISGWTKFFQAVFTDGGIEALITNSPSGSVFFQETSKVQNLIRSVLRMVNVVEDPMELTTLKDVGMEAARLIGGSGWTNAEKALFILEHGKRKASDGSLAGDDLGHMEVVAQLLGFGGYDEKQLFELSFEASKTRRKSEDRWNRDYKIIMRYYTDQLNAGRTDWDVISTITGHVFSVYKGDYEAQKYIMGRLGADLRAGEDNANRVLSQVMKMSGYKSPGEVKDMLKTAPGLSDDQRKQLMEIVDFIANQKGE